ncbi:MAG TPA: RsmG family class I SAM-dependent methyltransferase [Candidatus Baltobacteraceae bacterium]|nr:RsmG family class I SAM-dependent methyltransferase [Candidatus Baltobacteraceae bacterium]
MKLHADPRMAEFVRRLLERNARMNLTGARSDAAVAEHIEDALSLVPFIAPPYVDVGSGGGFPAIPLAIATGVRTTMVEATAKKAEFLREMVDGLALDAEVVVDRAERVARDLEYRERYGSATARGVGGVATVLELMLPLLQLGGVAILQRGAPDLNEPRILADASLALGGRLEAEHTVRGGRRILLVRKVEQTSARFPRRVGLPEKRPLCR